MAFILDDILLAPIKLVKWIGSKLYEQARGELTDKSKIQEELLDLQMKFEMEEITEEEYDKREKELMERLNAIEEAERK